MLYERITIRSYQRGLLFKDKEFKKILPAGTYRFFDITGKTEVDVVSMRDPWLKHDDLDLIISSGQLGEDAQVLELADGERGLVWIENRFAGICGPGQYALWSRIKKIRIDVIEISAVSFEHEQLTSILQTKGVECELEAHRIDEGSVGMVFCNGNLLNVLAPGLHAFWKKAGDIRVVPVDTREATLDVSGQEILTKDKVSLRMNGLITYRVTDPKLAVTEVEDYIQSLYRETQLALRSEVGTRDLDNLLADKEAPAKAVSTSLRQRVESFGVKIIDFGIRDLILPGDMKELLNRVVESKKAAEANLITRREETAAMRSQANTAKILADNPTLMRLRELELLEKVAASSNLNIVCGEGALRESIVKMI